jgi:glucokinase
MTMAILAGDIGATKTVLAIFERAAHGLETAAEATYASRAHDSLEEPLDHFLGAHRAVELRAACFGVAGTVIEGRSSLMNLPWKLEEAELERTTGAPRVALLNDVEAAAYGMLMLGDGERVTLNPGSPQPHANIAVMAAGTGLGESFLCWDGERYRAAATEGGHANFAPRTDLEIDLLRFLRDDFGGRVSTERLLSGPGLHNIYRFVRQHSSEAEPRWISDRMAEEDPSAVISELALASKDAACAESLKLFASIYGAEAGDIALRYLSLGGLFIGGGIAPKILPALQTDAFRSAFVDKGRYSELVAGIPVWVSLEPRAPLLGAAHYALSL